MVIRKLTLRKGAESKTKRNRGGTEGEDLIADLERGKSQKIEGKRSKRY